MLEYVQSEYFGRLVEAGAFPIMFMGRRPKTIQPKYSSGTVVFELCINLLLKYITLFIDFVERGKI